LGLRDIVPVTAEAYLAGARASGRRVARTPDGTWWVGTERGAVSRFPAFEVGRVAAHEARRACWLTQAAIAGHLQPAGPGVPSTATLYVCRHGDYALARLDEPVRRHVRRALRELTFAVVDRETLLRDGAPAFCETRARTGLDDGTSDEFRRRFEAFFRHVGHHVLGAWRGPVLAAYFTMVVVDDWVEIGGFSSDAHLDLRPNNGLVHHILEHFLNERGFRVVSYGLSSLQADTNAEGLDRYKRRIGFSGDPVRRTMTLHPALAPFMGRGTLSVVQRLLAWQPRNRLLKKAEGALRLVSEGT
jgi:hypothetical protein